MNTQFERLAGEIRAAASSAGLVVFDGVPERDSMPSTIWQDDWPEFIDIARRANATLLYLQEWKHDPDVLIERIVADRVAVPISDEEDDDEAFVVDERDWLRNRLREACEPWNAFRNLLSGVECAWFRDGVAHLWRREADWAEDFHDAFQAALDQSSQVDKQNRILRSEEATRKLQMYANILAMHPRFSEAKSEDKREFMVERMFGDDLRKETPHYQLFPHSIARRASLIYWWDIEPGERLTVKERARELRENGESIKNIAAALHISEAKVRAALSD